MPRRSARWRRCQAVTGKGRGRRWTARSMINFAPFFFLWACLGKGKAGSADMHADLVRPATDGPSLLNPGAGPDLDWAIARGTDRGRGTREKEPSEQGLGLALGVSDSRDLTPTGG